MSIIVIGAVFVDIKGYPSRTYIPGGRNAGKVRYVHGGVSRNIAEDLGNMGLDPVFLSLVDPSGSGEDVLLRLKDHGVDTRFIRKVPEGMGTWLAVFDNNNDVCASISHRPDLKPLLSLLQEEGNLQRMLIEKGIYALSGCDFEGLDERYVRLCVPVKQSLPRLTDALESLERGSC